MDDFIPQIRNSARALIRCNRHILLIRKEYDDGQVWYTFPGGDQESGETLEQTLNRECLGEIGTEVEVKKLLHVIDSLKPADTMLSATRHPAEFFFECCVPDSYTPRNGSRPDKHQVAVIWKDITHLVSTDYFPQAITSYLESSVKCTGTVYPGKIG